MPRININTPVEMQQAGDGYIPIFQGEEMLPEGALPETSLENLRRLLDAGLEVRRFVAVPGQNVLVEFKTGEAYLATGFSFGDTGEASTAFAAFAELAGWGSRGELLRWIAALDPDWDTIIPLVNENNPNPRRLSESG